MRPVGVKKRETVEVMKSLIRLQHSGIIEADAAVHSTGLKAGVNENLSRLAGL
jgi:hypothetical protein